MEGLVQELQGIKHEHSKERAERDELAAENRRLKAENDSVRAAKLKVQEKLKIVENDKRKVDDDNARMRVAFRKVEDKKLELERELKETNNELEMFETMLKNTAKTLPGLNDSASDLSDWDTLGPTSPITKNRNYPSAGHAVSDGAPHPLTSSTPHANANNRSSKLVSQKVSLTTGLLQVSHEYEELARQAKEM